jgi:hypothetical protein
VLEQHGEALVADPGEDGLDVAFTHRTRRILEDLGLHARLLDHRRTTLSTCLGANALVQLFNDAAYPGVVGARRHAEAGEGS